MKKRPRESKMANVLDDGSVHSPYFEDICAALEYIEDIRWVMEGAQASLNKELQGVPPHWRECFQKFQSAGGVTSDEWVSWVRFQWSKVDLAPVPAHGPLRLVSHPRRRKENPDDGPRAA
jgi:hypothetical protein